MMTAQMDLSGSNDFVGGHTSPLSLLGYRPVTGPVSANPIDKTGGTGGGITTQPVARQTPPNESGGVAPQQTELPVGFVDTTDGCVYAGGGNWNCPGGTAGPSNGWVVPPVSSANDSPSPNAADCTSDPTLCALLGSLNGSANGSGPSYPGLGVPTGTIGSAPTNAGPNPIMLLAVIGLGVLGFYLWHKYKGKLVKHEDGE